MCFLHCWICVWDCTLRDGLWSSAKERVIEEKPRASSSDDRYKTLFERINAAAFFTSFEGQILEANQKSYEFLGYEGSMLLRLSFRIFCQRKLIGRSATMSLQRGDVSRLKAKACVRTGPGFPLRSASRFSV